MASKLSDHLASGPNSRNERPAPVQWKTFDRNDVDDYAEQLLEYESLVGDDWYVAYHIKESTAIDELYAMLSLVPTNRLRRELTVQFVAKHFTRTLTDAERRIWRYDRAIEVALDYLENPAIEIDDLDLTGRVIAHSSHFLLDVEGFIQLRADEGVPRELAPLPSPLVA